MAGAGLEKQSYFLSRLFQGIFHNLYCYMVSVALATRRKVTRYGEYLDGITNGSRTNILSNESHIRL